MSDSIDYSYAGPGTKRRLHEERKARAQKQPRRKRPKIVRERLPIEPSPPLRDGPGDVLTMKRIVERHAHSKSSREIESILRAKGLRLSLVAISGLRTKVRSGIKP